MAKSAKCSDITPKTSNPNWQRMSTANGKLVISGANSQPFSKYRKQKNPNNSAGWIKKYKKTTLPLSIPLLHDSQHLRKNWHH
jgi:hypothetical protein